MGFLLFIALCIVFLEAKLILQQYSYIQKLVGARHELKVENERLKRKVENIVLKID